MTGRGRTALAGTAPVSAPSALRALAVIGIPPLLWFAHLNVSYLLVPPSCSWGSRWPLVAVTVVALVAMVPGGLLSWRARTGEGDDATPLVRFLGSFGVALLALFALVTLLVGASAVVIHPCH